jgi:hypothetical protein
MDAIAVFFVLQRMALLPGCLTGQRINVGQQFRFIVLNVIARLWAQVDQICFAALGTPVAWDVSPRLHSC